MEGPLTAPTAPQMTDVGPNRCGEPNRPGEPSPFRAGREEVRSLGKIDGELTQGH